MTDQLELIALGMRLAGRRDAIPDDVFYEPGIRHLFEGSAESRSLALSQFLSGIGATHEGGDIVATVADALIKRREWTLAKAKLRAAEQTLNLANIAGKEAVDKLVKAINSVEAT